MQRHDAFPLLLRRWAGCWIDLIVGAVLLIISLFAAGEQRIELGMVVGVFLVPGYFLVCETIWGRTLGKLITGTVVVNESGGKPGFVRVLLRTLMRLVEVNPFLIGGVPAGIVMLITKKKQRLGDLLAGTYVLPIAELRRFEAVTAAVFE